MRIAIASMRFALAAPAPLTVGASLDELTVLEGTGIYKPFVGGHNHMVDKLHFLAPGNGSDGIDEYCFCFVSRQMNNT